MYQLILNLIPQGILPRLNVSQYDHGQTVDVTLYEGSTAYTLPNGATVTVSGTKADNTGFEYNCDLTDGISFAIEEQMTVFAGEVECELTIRYGNNRISTINFILDVERAALQDDVVISETDLPIIQQLPEKLAEAETYADRAEQAAATAMSTDAGKVTDRLNLNNTRNLVVPADINYTRYGVTIKSNADGSITLSGARSGSGFILYGNLFAANSGGNNSDGNPQKWLPNGKYRIYGDVVGGRISGKTRLQVLGVDSNNQQVFLAQNDTATYTDFTVTDSVAVVSVRVFVDANADFGSGMTIYPMITTQSTENVTGYEQGALSNRALTLKMQALDQDTLFQRAVKNGYKASITNIGDTNPYSILNQPYLYSQAETTGLPSGATSGVTTCFALGDGSIQIVLHDFSNKEFRKTYVKGSAWTSWVEVQLASDSSLQTTAKTIVGAINELKARIDAL